MSRPTESYRKVQYDLRPAKQVERRMLIDAFQMLTMAGFPIRDYQYTGFGSVYFVDFILLHKLLGVHRMVSVEHSTKVFKRVKFNKPYGSIEVKMGEASTIIPTLSQDLKHILWLDYDDVLNEGHLMDVRLAATYLSPGSILLITVDAEPPGDDSSGPEDWMEHFRTEGGEYAQTLTSISDFSRSKLFRVNIELLERAIRAGLSGRGHVQILPLFNFDYADGHRMLTIGCMFVGDAERRQVLSSKLSTACYARFDWRKAPYVISIPRLTRKERMHLDARMPCNPKWRPTEFEISEQEVSAYREIYPFFPAYAEMLL